MLIRSLAPPVYPVTSFQLPTAQITTFSNGAKLHVLKGSSQPVIKFEIIFKAGKRYETKKGVSYLAAKMLLEGSEKYSAKEIADKIAFYGASLECNQGFDHSSLTLYCLSKHFKDIFPLIVEIVNNSTIPVQELELLKTRTIQNIAIEKERNSYLATSLLTKNIYGEHHPYVTGQEEVDVDSINRDDILAFIENSYRTEAAIYFLTGDITKEQEDRIQLAFDKTFINNLTAETFDVPQSSERNLFLEKSDKLQSSIRIGSSWPLMQHPDYPKLALLNKILGGYFGSRLMKNIREEKGFTYGISSALSPKEKDTLFYIGTDINYQNTDETIQEIKKEITKLQEELISTEELETVKNYTIGKFINETTTIFDQSEKYKNTVLKGLPNNYYSIYLHSLRNSSPTEILNLAGLYFDLTKLHYVVVGKR